MKRDKKSLNTFLYCTNFSMTINHSYSNPLSQKEDYALNFLINT